MSIPSVINKQGVAVITGGASGFGLEAATRCVASGMKVALLDVSQEELSNAEKTLKGSGGDVLAVRCNVVSQEDCAKAQAAVAAAFPNAPISFLFNNAGIHGPFKGGGVIEGDSIDPWKQIFNVNVFGAVNILKAFVPGMLGENKPKAYIVTTSSIVGLTQVEPGAYSASKFAVTGLCESFSLELDAMGSRAAHVSAHTLHPTAAATAFMNARGEDGSGSKAVGDKLRSRFEGVGAFGAKEIVDGMFKGLDAGKHYIVVDHPDDDTPGEIKKRMEDQMSGSKPRPPKTLAVMERANAARKSKL